MKIQESAENYLETILMIKEEKGSVRSIDIVHHMDFSKPSVSRAVGLLRDNGYITVDRDGYIDLTTSGNVIASAILERHKLFNRWLVYLGVDEETAAAEACRMEHAISEETFQKIKEHIRTSCGIVGE